MENIPQVAGQSPPPPAPPAPDAPPPPPAPNATNAEWHDWRRRQRDFNRAHYGWGWSGMWGWFWAIALIVVGGYYLLVNFGFLSWIMGDVIWPVLLIVLGVLILVGRFRPWRA